MHLEERIDRARSLKRVDKLGGRHTRGITRKLLSLVEQSVLLLDSLASLLLYHALLFLYIHSLLHGLVLTAEVHFLDLLLLFARLLIIDRTEFESTLLHGDVRMGVLVTL